MAVYFGAFEVAEQSWTKFKKAFFILVFIYSVMLIVGSFLGSKEAFSPLSGLNLAKNASIDAGELKKALVSELNELGAQFINDEIYELKKRYVCQRESNL